MIGLKMYTDGVMIVGFSEIEDIHGKFVTLNEISLLEEGDRIIKINGNEINNIEELKKHINSSDGESLFVEVINVDGEYKNVKVNPIHTSSNEYKLGLWVKDAATGVGTLSFYIPQTQKFVALGHGIIDSDTGNLIEIEYGEITTTDIVSITKGEAGNPGEVRGIINGAETIGIVDKNTQFGLFGNIQNLELLNQENEVEIALRSEVKSGVATILSDVSEQGVKEYKVQIEDIYLNNNEDNKSFVVRVTDENLISKTGGIIRGLSGSPILQNGKLIGVITNVLVSNPKVGFGVFADLMLENLVE